MKTPKGIEASKSLYEVYSKQTHISEDCYGNHFFWHIVNLKSIFMIRFINGEVISKLGSDVAEDTVTVLEPLSTEGRALIKKRKFKRTKKHRIEISIADKSIAHM